MKLLFQAFLIFFCFESISNANDWKKITIGREFTALAEATLTPRHLLETIQSWRGGKIKVPAEKSKGKWILIDESGKKWGAERDHHIISGGSKLPILEIQSPPVVKRTAKLMLIPLQAFLKNGAEPMYSVGGGHIHIGLNEYFLPKPMRFASLMNLLLNFEDLLVYVFSNPRRVQNFRKLSQIRKDGKTLAQHLGKRLNTCIDRESEKCVIDSLKKFSLHMLPNRYVDFNLRSWVGSSKKKKHGTLELRFFNAPKKLKEVVLEERLVRAIAKLSVASEKHPIRYNPMVDSLTGENAYYDEERLNKDFYILLKKLKVKNPEAYFDLFIERLDERRHPKN